MSLAEAVLTATKAKPLSKPEILTAIEKLGYKFTAKSPLNSAQYTSVHEQADQEPRREVRAKVAGSL